MFYLSKCAMQVIQFQAQSFLFRLIDLFLLIMLMQYLITLQILANSLERDSSSKVAFSGNEMIHCFF